MHSNPPFPQQHPGQHPRHPPVATVFAPDIAIANVKIPRIFDHPNPQHYPHYPQPTYPSPPGSSRVVPQQLFSLPVPRPEDENDQDDDDEFYDTRDDQRGKGKTSTLGGPRVAGACDPCKQSKVKCVFAGPGVKCRRCAHNGLDCHISGRKQKPPPPSHAELQSRLREKDDVIRRLLDPSGQAVPPSTFSNPDSQETNRPDNGILPVLPIWDKRTPKREVEYLVEAWITEARRRMMQGVSEGSGENAEDTTDTPHLKRWKVPRTPTDFNATPEILTSGLISHHEGQQLFDLFFDKINMFFSVCDPEIHTPEYVLRTNPFLYTTICAVASRHYTPRPDLYQRLLDNAKNAAGAALNGVKSIETCQAYLLLGVYNPPSRSFMEDRNFLYLGLALRIATDLELHLPPPATSKPKDERALLNRARVWLNCFCTDRSISTQLGKPSAISIKTFPCDLKEWWRSSQYNGPHDIHMCAYASLLQVMSKFHDARGDGGCKREIDLRLVQDYADQITAVSEDWRLQMEENSLKRPHPKTTWRDNLWPFMVSYARLVVVSMGLQDGMRQGLRYDNPFSDQCIDTALDILRHVTGKLRNLGYLRYSVESHFVFIGFAAAFLLKSLQPKFSFMMRPGREEEILQLVQRLINVLGSDEVAIDARHTAKLYSRFLASVLADKYKNKNKSKNSIGHAAMAASLPQPPLLLPPLQQQQEPQSAAAFYTAMDGVASTSTSTPQLALPQPPLLPLQQQQLPETVWTYDPQQFQTFMDVDAGGQNDMMLPSMAAITDPRFWDQGTMPGWSGMSGMGGAGDMGQVYQYDTGFGGML